MGPVVRFPKYNTVPAAVPKLVTLVSVSLPCKAKVPLLATVAAGLNEKLLPARKKVLPAAMVSELAVMLCPSVTVEPPVSWTFSVAKVVGALPPSNWALLPAKVTVPVLDKAVEPELLRKPPFTVSVLATVNSRPGQRQRSGHRRVVGQRHGGGVVDDQVVE